MAEGDRLKEEQLTKLFLEFEDHVSPSLIFLHFDLIDSEEALAGW
jgi:hypothetical protein